MHYDTYTTPIGYAFYAIACAKERGKHEAIAKFKFNSDYLLGKEALTELIQFLQTKGYQADIIQNECDSELVNGEILEQQHIQLRITWPTEPPT